MAVYKLQNPKWDNDGIVIICDCGDVEHQIAIYHWSEDDEFLPSEFSFQPHLTTYKNVFQRLWYAIKYVLGYKSKYGAFDEMLLTENDIEQIVVWFESKCYNSTTGRL